MNLERLEGPRMVYNFSPLVQEKSYYIVLPWYFRGEIPVKRMFWSRYKEGWVGTPPTGFGLNQPWPLASHRVFRRYHELTGKPCVWNCCNSPFWSFWCQLIGLSISAPQTTRSFESLASRQFVWVYVCVFILIHRTRYRDA